MRTLEDTVEKLKADVQSLRLRVIKHDVVAEPACASGLRVFTPDTTTSFLLDRLGDGSAAVNCQYVLRDGMTYEIPVVMPPPGLFEARFLRVAITQRLFQPTVGAVLGGVQQISVPMNPALSYSQVNVASGGLQTLKWSCIPNRFIQFYWNIIEGKSGRQLSDEMLPDAALLPALSRAPSFGTDERQIAGDSGDVGLELDALWLFERDADIRFLFRPVTAVIQPAADSGVSPFSFDDREVNNTVRNAAITVQVELHGSRIYTDVDAARAGARVDPVDTYPRGGFG